MVGIKITEFVNVFLQWDHKLHNLLDLTRFMLSTTGANLCQTEDADPACDHSSSWVLWFCLKISWWH